MHTVIVIDDQVTTNKLLTQLVKQIRVKDEPVNVESFTDCRDAFNWLKIHTAELILVDYKMPNLNGIEFIKLVRRMDKCNDIPIIMITAFDDKPIRYSALEAGAQDFLSKPLDHHECKARCKNLLDLGVNQKELKRANQILQKKINASMQAVIERERETLLRLARAGEYRDEETGEHIYRIARYSRLIAEKIGLHPVQCDVIEQASPMHDVGKIGIPDYILLKRDQLSEDEFSIMKTHTIIGFEILKDSPSEYLQVGANIALEHHEHFNGQGYPKGKRGDEITIEARIVAIADVFDALTSIRPYKKAWSFEDAFAFINNQKGRQFDPECVEVFLEHADQVKEIYDTHFEDKPNHFTNPNFELFEESK
jgi:two-component system response regulator RpfG